MKIAINCVFFQPKGGGINEYILNLTSNLADIDTVNDYILYVLEDQLDYAIQNLPGKMRIKTLPYRSDSLKEIIRRSLFEQSYWKKEEQIEHFDIFHSPFFHSPQFNHAKVILTVHDLRFYRYPDTYSFLRYIFLRYTVKKSILSANHIISISSFTKNEIIEAYGIADNKVTVIHEAINEDRFTIKEPFFFEGMPSLQNVDFLLSVGHVEPRKNYERLILAFEDLKKEKKYEELKLVIVGKKGHHYRKVLAMISQNPDIYYLDFVSHEMLIWLYKNAKLFVFPSLYEGFGFPPLEAGCLGTISVVSKVSSMPEICGNSVFYCNPLDYRDIKFQIVSALSKLYSMHIMQIYIMDNLLRFSWSKNAKETLALYNSLYND